MTFAEAWEQWGRDILLDRPELFPQQERAWFFHGMGNLARNRWNETVLPPLSDFGVIVLPPEPGFATPVEQPPKEKKPKASKSPARLPKAKYWGPPEEWPEFDNDYSLHMNPDDYGIPEEDRLWWEVDEPWEPDRDVSPQDMRDAKYLAAYWSRTHREGL